MIVELTQDEAQFIIAALNKVQLSGTAETLAVALAMIEQIAKKLQGGVESASRVDATRLEND